MSFYQSRYKCRLCEAAALVPAFSLGEQYMTAFPLPGEPKPAKAPLDVVICEKCGLSQLGHDIDVSDIYKDYYYRSGVSETMREALGNIIHGTMMRSPLQYRSRVLDIGSNDGTLLSIYPPDIEKVGVEPSNIAGFSPSDIQVHRRFFDSSFHDGKFSYITAVAMFYDVPDPADFLVGVRQSLEDDGVFVCQMNYLPSIWKNNAYDFVSHEHVTMWTLKTFMDAVEKAGLSVFDVEINDLNGGSFRAYCQHRHGGRQIQDSVGEVLAGERGSGKRSWTEFGKRVDANTSALQVLVREEMLIGKRVLIRGASTRGYTILQKARLDPWVKYAGDRDPRKHGRLYGASGVLIINEEEAREKADWFVVLIYSYIKQIAARDHDFLMRGGGYIVPMPEVRMLKAKELLRA